MDALAELERVCFSQPWSREGLRTELTNPAARFLVAEIAGKTAGYGGMHCAVGEYYIDNIAVFPEFRGRGVGRALVEGLKEIVRREEGEFLSLEVRPSNKTAVGLYEQAGFDRIGLRKGFYENPKEDALIMTLRFAIF